MDESAMTYSGLPVALVLEQRELIGADGADQRLLPTSCGSAVHLISTQ